MIVEDFEAKEIVESNKEAVHILNHFHGRVKVTFGIGTNLTNDFKDVEPLQIVMKMTK
jgi:nicotinic acid phosphoribosyltransferase